MRQRIIKTVKPSPPPAGVCVLTARGMAAISSIAVVGKEAEGIVERLLGKASPPCGRFLAGTIREGADVVDSVVAACEGPGRYVIHCHGNPLLVERIAELCVQNGAMRQTPEDYLFARLKTECETLIEAEARLAMTRAATLEGVEILAGQISGGLSMWAKQRIDSTSFDISRLHKECLEIFVRSTIAQRLICGVKIALVGRPNSGKSTLLNWLAADKAALVSETAGTTRDWVSTVCRIGPLRAEVVDTAGLDEGLAESGDLERTAQEFALEVMQCCDLLVHIRDCRRPESEDSLDSLITDLNPGLTLYTKSDLLGDPDGFSPDCERPWVLVSAATHQGLEALCKAILSSLNIDTIRHEEPVCFNDRQLDCLEAIRGTKSQKLAAKELKSLWGVF